MYISRPIKFDTFQEKRPRMAAMRCIAVGASFSHFYVLGSNDTRVWKYVTHSTREPGVGKTMDVADHVRNYIIGSHYKYFCIVHIVRAMPGTSFSLAEFYVVGIFTTKLR
jgi:hypothetical protein